MSTYFDTRSRYALHSWLMGHSRTSQSHSEAPGLPKCSRNAVEVHHFGVYVRHRCHYNACHMAVARSLWPPSEATASISITDGNKLKSQSARVKSQWQPMLLVAGLTGQLDDGRLCDIAGTLCRGRRVVTNGHPGVVNCRRRLSC